MLSARLGDVLSELYLLSCVLKRFHSEGQPHDDLPLVDWCCRRGFAAIERSFGEVFDNYPSRLLAGLMRVVVLPFGRRRRGPSDALSRRCADLVTTPGATRERLTAGVHLGGPGEGAWIVEHAFARVSDCAAIRRRMADAGIDDPDRALEQGVLDADEHRALQAADAAVAEAIAVDDFEPGALSPRERQIEEGPSQRLRQAGRSS